MIDPTWIPAKEALTILQPFYGGRRATKDMLADMLRDGELQSMAKLRWTSKEPKLRFKEPHADATDRAEQAEIPVQVWRRSKRWSSNQEKWRWPSGNFFVTVGTAPPKRVFLKGVHFDRQQIFSTHRRAKDTEEKQKRGGGRTTPAAKWAIITEAILRLQREGTLTRANYETAESLALDLQANPNIDNLFGRTVLEKFCGHIVRHCIR